uniref:NADH-ubiquinone oxidoreductase chain 2 n=1 Tax=Porcellio dilatatus dilatatus TaxID=96810 RepID=A0A1P8DKG8_PORDI|nr:NADH dehydrogenase subunit 2 [Porcellio dilatatus dilatatus]
MMVNSKLMFNYLWGLMFFSGLLSGVLISISSDSWVGVWLGLEMNLLCFIPIISGSRGGASEAMMIYFLIQACGSLMLLMTGLNLMNYELMFKVFISVALLLKVGAAPFHFWYIEVASKLRWVQFIIISSVQKIIPLTLLSLNSMGKNSWVVYLSVVWSGLTGAIGGINAFAVRKLLVYSSIGHLGWVLAPLVGGSVMWVTYFSVYCLNLLLVVLILTKYSVFHINQLKGAKILWSGGLALLISLLSLGGFPPSLGFAAKWGVIVSSVEFMDLFSLSILILSSVISVYFYTRLGLTVLVMNSEAKFNSGSLSDMGIFSGVVSMSLVGFWVSFMIMF